MRSRSRWRSEHGQATAEHAGALVIVALIIVALLAVATPIGQRVSCAAGQAIAGLVNQSLSCDAGGGDPYAVDPGSVVRSSEEKKHSTNVGVEIPAGPGSVTGDYTNSQSTERSVYFDDSGSVTAKETQELAAGYKVDPTKLGKAGKTSEGSDSEGSSDPFSKKLEASATLSGSRTTTRTWECDKPGKLACAEIDPDRGSSRFDGPPSGAAPDKTTEAYNAKLNLKGEGSVGVKEPGAEDGSSADLEVKASLKLSGEVGYTHTTSSSTDADGRTTTTTSHKFNYKGSVDASAKGTATDPMTGLGLESEVGGGASYLGSYETTYDSDGNLKTITFTTVAEGHAAGDIKLGRSGEKDANGKQDKVSSGVNGSPTVTSTVKTTLDVSTLSPEERRIAEAYVNGSLTNGALLVPPSVTSPSSPSDDPFEQLLYEKAQSTRTMQQGGKITEKGGVDLIFVHWNDTTETTTTDTVSVETLGAPGADGTRSFEDAGVGP